MRKELVKKSKFLSLILRHNPGKVGIELDEAGRVDVDLLLAAVQKRQRDFKREVLEEVVATNDKRRFVFSDDGKRIRAAQGHSIGVDLGLAPTVPPDLLYHGTAEGNLESIRQHGLIRGARDHVHLSKDAETATRVGQRHGRPVVLIVGAARMVQAGHTFYLSDNGVWLTAAVPVEFIEFP